MLRGGWELVGDFQSKQHFMPSGSLVWWWLEPGAIQRMLHAVIRKTNALKSSQPPPFTSLQVTGEDLQRHSMHLFI